MVMRLLRRLRQEDCKLKGSLDDIVIFKGARWLSRQRLLHLCLILRVHIVEGKMAAS